MKRLIVLVLLFPSLAMAVDDATVQAIDSKASQAKSKSDQNASEIESLKGGLPAEREARIASDNNLQFQIDNIQLTPGPKGDQGDPGPQGPAGADGMPGSDNEAREAICFIYTHYSLPQPAFCETLPPVVSIGNISGEIGYVLQEATLPTPSLYVNQIDFVSPVTSEELLLLEESGAAILGENLGGSAAYTAAISFSMLQRVEGAEFLKSGSEIAYLDAAGKKTNYMVTVGGEKLGVYVTRAFTLPLGSLFTQGAASTLLEGKLADILLSTANVSPEDLWTKQVLHVIAYDDQHAQLLRTVYESGLIDASLKANTIVYISSTEGDDAFLY